LKPHHFDLLRPFIGVIALGSLCLSCAPEITPSKKAEKLGIEFATGRTAKYCLATSTNLAKSCREVEEGFREQCYADISAFSASCLGASYRQNDVCMEVSEKGADAWLKSYCADADLHPEECEKALQGAASQCRKKLPEADCSNAKGDKIACQVEVVLRGKDPALCGNLTSERSFDSCLKKVAAQGFPEACAHSSNANEVSGCFYEIARQLEKPSVCTGLPSASARDACLSQYAKAKQAADVCALIEDKLTRRGCAKNIPWSNDKPDKEGGCEKLVDIASKNACYEATLDCGKISTSAGRISCVERRGKGNFLRCAGELLSPQQRTRCMEEGNAPRDVKEPSLACTIFEGREFDLCLARFAEERAILIRVRRELDSGQASQICQAATTEHGNQLCMIRAAQGAQSADLCKEVLPSYRALCVARVRTHVTEPAMCDYLLQNSQKGYCKAEAARRSR
jgi:hypothetical protein